MKNRSIIVNVFFVLYATGSYVMATELRVKGPTFHSGYEEGHGTKPEPDSISNAFINAKQPPRKGKTTAAGTEVYTMSGIGTALTYGETEDILSHRTSTSLGFNIALRKSAFFLYPSADLLVFEYNQQITDPDYKFDTKRGRSTFTTFNLMAGARARAGSFSAYIFGGPGLSLIKEPRTVVNEAVNTSSSAKQKSKSFTLKGGLGLDYKIGAFTLFAEGSYARYFKTLQDRQIEMFPVFGGMKSDISAIFYKKLSK